MTMMIRGSVLGKLFLLAICLGIIAPTFAGPQSGMIDAKVLNNITTINPFNLTVSKTKTPSSVLLLAAHTLNKQGARVYTLPDGTEVTLRPRQVIIPHKPSFRSPWCLE